MVLLGFGGGFGASMQARRASSTVLHALPVWPAEAQHAVSELAPVDLVGKQSRPTEDRGHDGEAGVLLALVWVADPKPREGGKTDWVLGHGYDCCRSGLEGRDEVACYGNSNCIAR